MVTRGGGGASSSCDRGGVLLRVEGSSRDVVQALRLGVHGDGSTVSLEKKSIWGKKKN